MPALALFPAIDATGRRALWRSDGTLSGTVILSDDVTFGSGFTRLADGRVVFHGENDSVGHELFVTDGTTAGTRLLFDLSPGPASSFPDQLHALGDGRLLFAAHDATHGSELWVTDGTAAVSRLVKDINPGEEASFTREFANLDGTRAVFVAEDGVHGAELWVTDGTEAGTFLVRDINPGPNNSLPHALTPLGNGRAIFFTVFPGMEGRLWATDGTAAGTHDLGLQAWTWVRFGDGTALGAGEQVATSVDGLWRTDGTPAGTTLISAAMNAAMGMTFTPLPDGRVLFSAATPEEGYELWVSDGTAAGTRLLADLTPGAADSAPFPFAELADGRILFVAQTAAFGRELWITDGTAAGTCQVRDINPGPEGSAPRSLAPLDDGRALFLAEDGEHGPELWVTDGSEAGTRLVKDIIPGPLGSGTPNFLTLPGGRALFTVFSDPMSGTWSIWRTDGTADGTQPLGLVSQTPYQLGATVSFNAAPTLTAPLPDRSGAEGALVSFDIPADAFTDADGDPLTFSARLATGAPLPSWLAFDPATRTFSGTPPFDAAGRVAIRVTATDPDGASATDEFDLVIANTNRAPRLVNPIPDQRALEGSRFVFTLPAETFTDPDLAVGDSLAYSVRLAWGGALPSWLSFNAATRVFSGTPPLSAPGRLDIRVTATDRDGSRVSDVFTLVIDNLLKGTNGDDRLQAEDGRANLVKAFAGNDLILAGSGEDRIDGGSGTDIVSYERSAAGVSVNLGRTGLQDTGGSGWDLFVYVENLRGSAFADTLVGNGQNNTLWGGDGRDRLEGGAGDDRLFGEAGDDVLLGGAGADWLDGGDGADHMEGGAGDDIYTVDSTGDRVVERPNQGTDVVRASVTYTLPNSVENLILTGTAVIAGTGNAIANVIQGNRAANLLRGGPGDDTLDGGGGNDTLLGNDDDDRLIGGPGADRLTGGAGRDLFVYRAITDSRPGAGSRDVITDFVVGLDRIDLSGMDGNSVMPGDQDFVFIGGGAFTGPGQVRVIQAGTNTLVQVNLDDTLAADFEIQLVGHLTLSAEDFILG